MLLAELQPGSVSVAGTSRDLRSWAYNQLSYILGSNPLQVWVWHQFFASFKMLFMVPERFSALPAGEFPGGLRQSGSLVPLAVSVDMSVPVLNHHPHRIICESDL